MATIQCKKLVFYAHLYNNASKDAVLCESSTPQPPRHAGATVGQAPTASGAFSKALGHPPAQPSSTIPMASVMHSAPSPGVRLKLLDLPNELLSRIIHFIIPLATTCPLSPAPPLDATNIGFTCERLYQIVKSRLSVLDFLTPADSTTHMVKFPRADNETIEKFTRLASPFLHVLRLPADFRNTNPDMSSMGCCRNVQELSIPIHYEMSVKGARNFLLPLRKLENLTIINARTPVFELIPMTTWKLRQLNIISVSATAANFKTLESILNMGTLQSLTINFECFGKKPVINEYNRDEIHNQLSFPETLHAFSAILRNSTKHLKALTKLSVFTVDRAPRYRELKEDGDDVNRMIDDINTLRGIVDNTRADGHDAQPYLNLTQFKINMWKEGEPAIENFMKGLLGTSTEVVVKFDNLTVSYPGAVNNGIYPRPVVTDLKFFFADEHWALTQNVDFKPTSVSILKKESAKMLTKELSHPFLSYALQGTIEAFKIEYLADTLEDVKVMLKALHFITCFSPGAKLLKLPVSVLMKSEWVSVEDLKKIKCADNVELLWLDFYIGEAIPDDPLSGLYLTDASVDFYGSNENMFLNHLPDFLNKVRLAFPKLKQLYVDRAPVVYSVPPHRVAWAEDVVKNFEETTGADASTLRQELRVWLQEKLAENHDLEKMQEALEKLRAFQAARALVVAEKMASGEFRIEDDDPPPDSEAQ